MNFKRILTVALIAAMLLVSALQPAEAAKRRHRAYTPPANRYAHILIEASTGYVISASNPDKHLYPASLTKMMTLYLAFEAMKDGKLDKNQYIRVSRHASRQEPSSLGLSEGDTIRVENVILGIATKSANDCAVTLAEAIGGGSESRFAQMMTAKARKLGMYNTNFVNASGLHNKSQYSSARDMAILAQALIRDYPRQYHYFSTESFTYGDNTYINHNHLMSMYRGMDGLKTGYVYASGFNLAASAVRNGTRLIGVVFGGRTAKSRNVAMAHLLDQGFASTNQSRAQALAAASPDKRLMPSAPISPTLLASAAPAVTVSAPDDGRDDDDMDQGDADAVGDVKAASVAPGAGGNWAVQIGTFASRDAGQKAIDAARKTLRGQEGAKSNALITPLMTNRGLIFHAKLTGLARGAATKACGTLKGNCLVMAAD